MLFHVLIWFQRASRTEFPAGQGPCLSRQYPTTAGALGKQQQRRRQQQPTQEKKNIYLGLGARKPPRRFAFPIVRKPPRCRAFPSPHAPGPPTFGLAKASDLERVGQSRPGFDRFFWGVDNISIVYIVDVSDWWVCCRVLWWIFEGLEVFSSSCSVDLSLAAFNFHGFLIERSTSHLRRSIKKHQTGETPLIPPQPLIAPHAAGTLFWPLRRGVGVTCGARQFWP